MSSSIEQIKVLKGNPMMPRELFLELLGSDGLPETNPLESLLPNACPKCKELQGWGMSAFCSKCGSPLVGEGPFPLKNSWGGISWGGCGSSDTSYLARILSQCEGDVDILIVWDGGDVEGLRVKDGKVTRPKVVISLED